MPTLPAASHDRALVFVDDEEDDYWRAATQVEAALILRDVAQATLGLESIVGQGLGDVASRARTRRQLEAICHASDIDPQVLDSLAVPSILHYCGHMDSTDAIRHKVDDFLAKYEIAAAYGSLARGADIIVVEALIERGSEVHIVLPFEVDAFETASVANERGDWQSRFRKCLASSTSVSLASDSGFLEDASLFGFASQVAMGRARNRARFLGVDAVQLAIWDGGATGALAGTAYDVSAWMRANGRTHTIPNPREASHANLSPKSSARNIFSMLFADFRGCSQMRDEHYDAFLLEIFGPISRVVDRHGEKVVYRNTWGDALALVFCDVGAAARCALEIQETLGLVDLKALNLPLSFGLRIALHVGRVLAREDPIRAVPSFWGREFTRTARIEPQTPEGEVYATDNFAALLALEPDSGCTCDYVGRVTTAKGFETIPMHRVRRTLTP